MTCFVKCSLLRNLHFLIFINYATYWALAHLTLQHFYRSIVICRTWSLVYWWWLEYYANWETRVINGWWLNLANFKKAIVSSFGDETLGVVILGCANPRFAFGVSRGVCGLVLIHLEFWNKFLFFGDTWFVVYCCKYIVKLWLILWREQCIYLYLS